MNLADVRVIGTTALTAAAVSLVTVVVYQGHVNVTSHGQTTQVGAGESLTVRPADEAREPALVGGSAPDLEQLRLQLRDLQARLEVAERQAAPPSRTIALDPSTCDQVSCVLNNYEGACCAKYKTQTAPLMSSSSPGINKVLASLKAVLDTCYDGGARRSLSSILTLEPDGRVSKVEFEAADARVTSCLESVLLGARFDASPGVRAVSYVHTFKARSGTACDADALTERGEAQYARDEFAASLATYEESLRCKPNASVSQKALMAACNLQDLATARRHWARLSPALRAQVTNVCVRNGITDDDLAELPGKAADPTDRTAGPASKPAEPEREASAPCDPGALADAARDAFALGKFAAALESYDRSLACKHEPLIVQKAFIVACNMRDRAKATSYWRRLTPEHRRQAVNVCVRNGILETDLSSP